MLLIVITISGYGTGSTVDSKGAHLGALTGLAVVQGGQSDGISFGRLDTVIKPIEAPLAAEVPHDPIHYTVAEGDDLEGIADKFHLTVNAVRWSNEKLTHSTNVTKGQELVLPPIEGLVATVKAGDTVPALATKFHTNAKDIVDFDYLQDPEHVSPGTVLIIPGGRGEALYPVVSLSGKPHMGTFDHSKFTAGQCTWFVASLREVPWTGNAWEWYGGAKNLGYRVSPKWAPEPGAIMVDWASRTYGHVMYVNKVNADKSIVVWEMNYEYAYKSDERPITQAEEQRVGLIGFIYDDSHGT